MHNSPQPDSAPCLDVRSVSKTFRDGGHDVQALADVSLSAQPGEFITIIGPSGSGKSTLFNLITGLTQPDRGEIVINGAPIGHRAGLVGYMPQRDLLLPWRTVLNNVILGPELDGRSRKEARQRARDLMPLFGLEGFENAFPDTLSGGMRQRAALLRTFLTDRDVLLLDEPFGALDALTRRDLQRWLLDVWQRFRKTILFITHDVEEAVFLGDRVLVFSARPGRIVRELRVDLPRPRGSLSVLSEDLRRLEADLLDALEQAENHG
ncbi:MAG TPA: ABC transporter ATP-binding protein [Aggregatilinea sp.]|uniref:ABC transporter ATP-binding protein n=1 Tax=Aggregatilinea sp. TaxID=2806333 RepID=UPI002BAC110D|nr:ABC transporter ATP-binding protein [Aggregatilinea sp.]HML23335.1 ABC transporter ATP-binding protein [Aggregatilinea sp.]